MNKVQALYDFTGVPGSSELSIKEGEILTLTRQDVGEGWWEGSNQNGQIGLFPAEYVQVIANQPIPLVGDNQPTTGSFESAEFSEEEWEENWDAFATPTIDNTKVEQSAIHSTISTNQEDNVPVITRKNFNRYSMFVKTGGESYFLGNSQRLVPENEQISIIETVNGVMWSPITDPYVCIVASPKKESKLKGLKSYIAYQITPSFNNIQVSRRYKHFDWLHERLEEKYSITPIPPLPDKQFSGRYEEQFIERRKNQLQAFVDYVCRHPVLSRSSVWEHFITCTDEKAWKFGKRKAEKDEFVGASYFYAIEAPEKSINQCALEQEILSCEQLVKNIDGAVKQLMDTVSDNIKHHKHYKEEYQRIALAFNTFAAAWASFKVVTPSLKNEGRRSEGDHARRRNTDVGNEPLSIAIKKVGINYNEISWLYEEQPKHDWEPFGDMLHLYKGILSSIPEIFSIHKKAIQTKKDCEKWTFEQKMSTNELNGVIRRTDIVSYALLAEINHFYSERTEEVIKTMKNFLTQQVEFHRKITAKLEAALAAMNF